MKKTFLIPKKIILRLNRYLLRIQYFIFQLNNNPEKIIEDEKRNFNNLRLDYIEAENKLNAILQTVLKRNFDRYNDSVHWLLFSALSLKQTKFSKILEIGTANGRFTKILSELFLNSEIDTIDLPENDPIFKTIYRRNNKEVVKEFKETQKINTEPKNINLTKINSFFIPEIFKNKYDLIWVDGGHLYPEIAWDLCNAYHLCKKNGYLLCDDIIICDKQISNKYVSNDSYKIIEYLCKRSNNSATFFLKRLSFKYNSSSITRKYVACMKKK
jgi:hypothetical protein